MDLEDILSRPETWKIIAAAGVPVATALATWVFRSPAMKVLTLFFGALGAVLCLLWYLDWIIFSSIMDLVLATLLLFSLHALFVSYVSFTIILLIDAAAFIFVNWFLPGMFSNSIILSAAIYAILANAFCYVAALIIYQAYDDDSTEY